ncbi:MAG: hypothetical protein OEX22_12755 [Cyclobacteriaceae bacterium]|nr:hypothetical protein [Cyclobacteriaceae bacterium]
MFFIIFHPVYYARIVVVNIKEGNSLIKLVGNIYSLNGEVLLFYGGEAG